MGKKVYVVTGEYITVQTATPDGNRIVGFYKGGVLPDDVPEASIEHHLSTNQIVEVDADDLASIEDKSVSEPDVPASGSPPPAPDDADTTDKHPANVGDQVEEPRRNASQEDWVEYAVSKGADREQATAASRDDLVAAWASKK